MQRYFDVVQNRQGTAVVGATVTVYDANGNLATLYSNNSNAASSNPVYTNSDGEYAFYAANGTYSITIALAGYATETKPGVVLFDPSDAQTANQINFLQAGTGAVTRTAQSKLRDVVSVKDFGAVGDGVTDDTAAIQAAIDGLATNGGTLLLPPGTYKISSTLTITESNILLLGFGGDANHNVGLQGAKAATELLWVGLSSGTMVKFESPAGASNQKKYGGGVKGIYFGANDVAGVGIKILSWSSAIFEDLHFSNPKSWGIDIDCTSSLGEARDTQYCRFSRCSSRHGETTGQTGGLLRLDSSNAGANPSLNYFELLDCYYVNGNAYELGDSDNNIFVRCRAFRASGTGNGIVCKGSNASAGQAARANMFLAFTGTSATSIICRGTSSFTYPSIDNSFYWLDSDNATPAPTIETAATAYYSFTNGINAFPSTIKAAFGEDNYAATQAKSLRGPSDSVFIVNGSDAHLIFSNPTGTNKWRLYLDSSGNLQVNQIAGTGWFDLGSAANIKINGQQVSLGANDSGGVGFKVLRVPN